MTDFVVGFGDNKIDYYVNQNMKYPGGNAVNFAIAGKRNGLNSYYVGSIPKDSDGELILTALKENKVDFSFCNRISTPSEKVFVDVKKGERIFLNSERGSRQTPELSDKLIALCKKSLLVHSGCHANTEDKLTVLKKNNVTLSFDFSDVKKYRTEEYLKRICPNITIAQFSVANDDEQEINKLIDACVDYGVKYILLTKGNESPLFVDNLSRQTYQGFIKKADDVKDTMGAGDAYFSAFAITLLSNLKQQPISEDLISECFKTAADYAYEVLQFDGAFGCGSKIKPE